MDRIYKAKKLQAMHTYNTWFLYNLVFHSLLALTCLLLCFYPYSCSFPLSVSSVNTSLFLSLQHKMASFFSPTCVFVIVNVIVAFLVGESKLVGSQASTYTGEIYDEYVERSRSNRRVSTLEHLELELMEEKGSTDTVQDKEVMEEGKQVATELTQKEHRPILPADDEEKEMDDEEEPGLPAEELKKKVEEFIARVNKQRLLETRSLVCCEA